MNSGIYCFTCLINGKMYIGKSINLKSRKLEHLSDLRKGRHKNYRLQEEFNIYGLDNFKYEILEYSESELNKKEKEYIKNYNTIKNGYNLTGGGEGSCIVKNETRKKLSELKSENKKKVFGFSKEGKLIKIWNSIHECSKEIGAGRSDIRDTMTGKQITCKGFILKSENNFEIRDSKIYSRNRDNLGRYI